MAQVLPSLIDFWKIGKETDWIIRKRWRKILFREYCFGEENSLSFMANSVSSAKDSVSSLWHTNNRMRGTHWVRSPELNEPQETRWESCFETVLPETVFSPCSESCLGGPRVVPTAASFFLGIFRSTAQVLKVDNPTTIHHGHRIPFCSNFVLPAKRMVFVWLCQRITNLMWTFASTKKKGWTPQALSGMHITALDQIWLHILLKMKVAPNFNKWPKKYPLWVQFFHFLVWCFSPKPREILKSKTCTRMFPLHCV